MNKTKIDGIKKRAVVHAILAKQAAVQIKRPANKIAMPAQQDKKAPQNKKHIHFFGFFDKKQLVTVASTFLITFSLSIAFSQGLAEINRAPAVAEQASELNPDGSALAVTNQPSSLPLDATVLNEPGQIYLPIEKIEAPDPLKDRKEFLKKYLGAKNSVLADHVDALSEQTQWKLIIAISRAESSFCKRKALNNCWGIGGAWNLKSYKNYDQAIADVNRILEQHYIQAGLNSPQKIVKKWVGHESTDWEDAVQQELDNLKNVQ